MPPFKKIIFGKGISLFKSESKYHIKKKKITPAKGKSTLWEEALSVKLDKDLPILLSWNLYF